MSDPDKQTNNGAQYSASRPNDPDRLGPEDRERSRWSEPDSGEAREQARGADSGERAASGHSHEQRCLEFCPICRAADILRASAPPELREQWQTVQREALLTTRALIEHYLARLDDEPAEPSARVEDIPIL